jgi:hypothetical protein
MVESVTRQPSAAAQPPPAPNKRIKSTAAASANHPTALQMESAPATKPRKKPKTKSKAATGKRSPMTAQERKYREQLKQMGNKPRRRQNKHPTRELDSGRPKMRSEEVVRKAVEELEEEMRLRLVELANAMWPFPDGYHLYRDEAGVAAKPQSPGSPAPVLSITLVRPLVRLNVALKAYLRLYESDDEPRVYATCLRMVSEQSIPSVVILAPEGSEWGVAWKAFTEKFQELTSVAWKDKEQAMQGKGKPFIQLEDGLYYLGGFQISM